MEFTVVDDNQIRLDVFLTNNTDFTRSAIKNLIDKGKVLHNDLVVKAGKMLKIGDRIKVDFEVVDKSIKPVNIPLDIVYEDADIAVINKQQGLTVHAGNGTDDNTLVNALLFHLKDLPTINCELRPGIVHRIDKNTSGLIVVAKNDFSHFNLSSQISSKVCKRKYVALVEGKFSASEGEIVAPIGRSKKNRTQMDIVSDGRYAKTFYRTLAIYGKYSLVEFELYTGRTHQIRVHCKYKGHPIVGDDVYNGNANKFGLSGQLLHAKTLVLTHPRNGKIMQFNAPLPDYFQRVVELLESN